MINSALEKFETTVVSYPSAKGLYEDMNVRFISHDFPQRLCGIRGKLKDRIKAVADSIDVESDMFYIGCNTSCVKMKNLGTKPKVIREDIDPEKKKDQVVIHARKISRVDKFAKAKYKRDWKDEFDNSVRHIKSLGFDVGFIGLPDQSICIPELGHDWRTQDISETIMRIKESFFMFGPSSGPFVLSVFCLTPIFTWGCRDFRLFHNKTFNTPQEEMPMTIMTPVIKYSICRKKPMH